MHRMGSTGTNLLSPHHAVNPVHPVQTSSRPLSVQTSLIRVRRSAILDPRPTTHDAFLAPPILIYSAAMLFSHAHVRRYPPKQKK
jgi:hypothetical protein